VLTGSCLNHVPDRAIVISSAPIISAQISKNMGCRIDSLHHVSRTARAGTGFPV